jgi:hypothetical protein
MTMTIIRQESAVDREGNPEVFCQVEFSNEELGTLHLAKWLTTAEVAAVTADHTAITAIMEAQESTAIARKREELIYLASVQPTE